MEAKKFSQLFNEIFLLFDFEKKYFEYPNFISTFIGHPVFHIKKRKINLIINLLLSTRK